MVRNMTERAVVAGLVGAADVNRAEACVTHRQDVIRKLGDSPLHLLIYDIPECLNHEAPNPSNIFWGHGFRLNKSCWVMSEEALNHDDIQAVLSHWDSIDPVEEQVHANLPYRRSVGVEWHTIQFDPSQVAKIRRIAQRELERFLVAIHKSLIERMIAADERLKAVEAEWVARQAEGGPAPTEKEQASARSRYDAQVRNLLRDAAENLAQAVESAQAFDATDDLADLFAAVRAAVVADVTAFNARMAVINRRQVELPTTVQNMPAPVVEPIPEPQPEPVAQETAEVVEFDVDEEVICVDASNQTFLVEGRTYTIEVVYPDGDVQYLGVKGSGRLWPADRFARRTPARVAALVS